MRGDSELEANRTRSAFLEKDADNVLMSVEIPCPLDDAEWHPQFTRKSEHYPLFRGSLDVRGSAVLSRITRASNHHRNMNRLEKGGDSGVFEKNVSARTENGPSNALRWPISSKADQQASAGHRYIGPQGTASAARR